MALQNFLSLKVLVNGTYQLKVSSISVDGQSNAAAVETLEGLLGKTDGASSVSVSLSAAVPTSGQEFNFWDTMADGEYLTVQIPVGDRSILVDGWVVSVSLSQSVSASTELQVTVQGKLEKLA